MREVAPLVGPHGNSNHNGRYRCPTVAFSKAWCPEFPRLDRCEQ